MVFHAMFSAVFVKVPCPKNDLLWNAKKNIQGGAP